MGEPSGPAPTLHSLEVTRLLDIDPPLEEAARTIAKKTMIDKMFPMFAADMGDGLDLENARALLLAREAQP
jgi:hypothetical protein